MKLTLMILALVCNASHMNTGNLVIMFFFECLWFHCQEIKQNKWCNLILCEYIYNHFSVLFESNVMKNYGVFFGEIFPVKIYIIIKIKLKSNLTNKFEGLIRLNYSLLFCCFWVQFFQKNLSNKHQCVAKISHPKKRTKEKSN